MTEKLTPEMLKDNAPWLACDGEAIVELEAYAAAWEAELARPRELIERAEAQMIGEDAQPLPEWEWYFGALEQEEQP